MLIRKTQWCAEVRLGLISFQSRLQIDASFQYQKFQVNMVKQQGCLYCTLSISNLYHAQERLLTANHSPCWPAFTLFFCAPFLGTLAYFYSQTAVSTQLVCEPPLNMVNKEVKFSNMPNIILITGKNYQSNAAVCRPTLSAVAVQLACAIPTRFQRKQTAVRQVRLLPNHIPSVPKHTVLFSRPPLQVD